MADAICGAAVMERPLIVSGRVREFGRVGVHLMNPFEHESDTQQDACAPN